MCKPNTFFCCRRGECSLPNPGRGVCQHPGECQGGLPGQGGPVKEADQRQESWTGEQLPAQPSQSGRKGKAIW